MKHNQLKNIDLSLVKGVHFLCTIPGPDYGSIYEWDKPEDGQWFELYNLGNNEWHFGLFENNEYSPKFLIDQIPVENIVKLVF